MKNLLNISLFTIAAIHSNFIEANISFSFEHHNKTLFTIAAIFAENIDDFVIVGTANEKDPQREDINLANMLITKIALKECRAFNGSHCNNLQQFLQTLPCGTTAEELKQSIEKNFGMVHIASHQINPN